MPFFEKPGVYTFENDYSNIVQGIATSTGATVGKFKWGPVEKVQIVSSENNLVRQFGEPGEDTYIDFYNAATFLAYSNDMRVVRVVGDAAKNATSGGDGSGLTLDVIATNGVVTGVTINTAGADYVTGDIVFIESPVTNAELRVTGVDDNGGVTAIVLLAGGDGHNSGSNVPTTILGSILVKNKDHFDSMNNLPEIVARYPSSLGNAIEVSTAKASTFDKWAFKDRFIVSPNADVVKYDGDGTTIEFDLPADMQTLPADAVVTNDGNIIKEGTDPGDYSVAGGKLTIITASESFNADGATNEFTLTNAQNLDLTTAKVDIDGTALTRYTGISDVPVGQFAINGNDVTIGINTSRFSGNGNTLVFTIPNVNGIDDAIVKVSGVAKTVVYTGTPAAGEVLIENDGPNTKVEFPVGEAPAVGNLNIEIFWNYPDNGSVVTVNYGFPKEGKGMVKIFTNEDEIHLVVVDKTGAWSRGVKETLLERYEALSLTPGAKTLDGQQNYYVDAVNRRSEYVMIGAPFGSWSDKRLTGGVDDDSNVSAADYINGWVMFQNPRVHDISHLVIGGADQEVGTWVIGNVCEVRKDVVAYISPKITSVLNNKNNEALACVEDREMFQSTSYGHFDCQWMLITDVYNDKTRWVPCAGSSAGIYALTHSSDNPWKSGAGLNRGHVRNALKLAWTPSDADMAVMYKNNVNTILWFKAEGPVLYGDKTMLTKKSSFDRMNVRWTFIVLKKSIAATSEYFVFENNNEATRNRWLNTVNPFLRYIKGKGGVEDIKAVCDENNNSAQIRAMHQFVGDIYVKPVYSTNFVILNFNAVAGDTTFTEIEQSAG
jgi:phage tail sheath protein FI